MSATSRTPSRAVAHVAIDHRRVALTAMVVLGGASALLLLPDQQVGPVWVHWVGTLLALVAALGVVAVADLNFQQAVTTAKAAGLVARSRTTTRDIETGDADRVGSAR